MKTSELTGHALNWAVAKCNGHVDDETIIRRLEPDDEGWCIAYSADWEQGGPIIEREGIDLIHVRQSDLSVVWDATYNEFVTASGPTPLIAAMRCFVASKLGDEVEVPEELK